MDRMDKRKLLFVFAMFMLICLVAGTGAKAHYMQPAVIGAVDGPRNVEVIEMSGATYISFEYRGENHVVRFS